MGFLYIFLTLVFTVYGQLVIKWQISMAGEFPVYFNDKMVFLLKQFLNPWIISGFVAAFIASLFWMATMTQFELSFAYPFMSLAFILVIFFSVFFLGEKLTLANGIGSFFVVLGLFIIAR